ncbi:MAG: DUF2169 domain-containing protein [Advenella sp.]|nr:DUF2169 domain-containing protein [Advenella sp.]
MKIIKPIRLSVMPRPYAWRGQTRLGLGVYALLDYSQGSVRLDSEQNLWKLVQEELDAGGVLDLAMPKPEPEFLVSGQAYTAFQEEKRQCAVKARVGELEKDLLVFGDRFWVNNEISRPQPFESMRINWANAFGGPSFERNPEGKGAAPEPFNGTLVQRLPNIEGLRNRVSDSRKQYEPEGFGAINITWPQRFSLVGTYSEQWRQHEFPGFFSDMNPAIFNAASADQRWRGHDSLPRAMPFSFYNMHPQLSCWSGILPDLQARAFVRLKQMAEADLLEIDMKASTVWFVPHTTQCIMMFHGSCPIAEEDGWDVECVMAGLELGGYERDLDYYRSVFGIRMDHKKAALYALKDEQLIQVPETMLLSFGDIPDPLQTSAFVRNQQNRAEAEREKARQRLRELGHDPAVFVAPEFVGPKKPLSFSELPEIFERLQQHVPDRETIEKQVRGEALSSLTKLKKEGRIQAGGPLDFEDSLKIGGMPITAENYGPLKIDRDGKLAQALEKLHQERKILREGGKLESKSTGAPLLDHDFMKHAQKKMDKLYLYSVQFLGEAPVAGPHRMEQMQEAVRHAYLKDKNLAGLDLTGIDLSDMDLRGANLQGAMLEGAILHNVRLDHANLTHAVLARAKISGSSFKDANLANSNLSQARIEHSTFEQACFDHAILFGLEAEQVQMTGARFKTCQFYQGKLQQVDLTGASFEQVAFHEVVLDRVGFIEAQLKQLAFSDCPLSHVSFERSEVEGGVFYQCGLEQLSFDQAWLKNIVFTQGVKLNCCTFRQSQIRTCNFRQTHMEQCDFKQALAENCDFSEAEISLCMMEHARFPQTLFVRTFFEKVSLQYSSLIGANLQKSVMKEVNLYRANLFRADVSGLMADRETVFDGIYAEQVKRFPEAKGA